MRKKSTKVKSTLPTFFVFWGWGGGGGGGGEMKFLFNFPLHPLQQLTMLTSVPTNRRNDNLKNTEILPVNFLMFNFKRVYLSCPSSDFNNLGTTIQVRSCFIQNQRNFENQTMGFCSIVYKTSDVFWDTRYRKKVLQNTFVISRRKAKPLFNLFWLFSKCKY